MKQKVENIVVAYHSGLVEYSALKSELYRIVGRSQHKQEAVSRWLRGVSTLQELLAQIA